MAYPLPPYQFGNICRWYLGFLAIKCRRYSILVVTTYLKFLSDWFVQWKATMNVNRTKFILLSILKQKSREKSTTGLNNTVLPWSEHCNYIPTILDKVLVFEHITTTRNKFPAARRKLKLLIGILICLLKTKCLLIFFHPHKRFHGVVICCLKSSQVNYLSSKSNSLSNSWHTMPC